jgi:Zinc finger, C3HC4 type (RING finger)
MSVPPEMIHPTSKWTEPITDSRYMLTLYDLNRNPRPVQNPSRRLTVSMAALNSEFVCPICLGYIRKASLVMECLHRFCAECIQKCLRFGRKECPSCRIHIPSRRSLRHDEEFDWILRHILGDVRALEEEDARQAELAKTRNLQISDSRKRGMLYQQEAMQQNKVCYGGYERYFQFMLSYFNPFLNPLQGICNHKQEREVFILWKSFRKCLSR